MSMPTNEQIDHFDKTGETPIGMCLSDFMGKLCQQAKLTNVTPGAALPEEPQRYNHDGHESPNGEIVLYEDYETCRTALTHATLAKEAAEKVVVTVHDERAREIALRLAAEQRVAALEANDRRYRELGIPEIHDFVLAVEREAAHQRDRWENAHDEGKTPEDWMWLLAHLATKATQASRYGDPDKYFHHIITCAAACCNWHANATGKNTVMRAGAHTDIAAVGQSEVSVISQPKPPHT